ncbi:MAG: S41 family peptidase, partial [Cetobacterium sp.]
MIKLLRSTGVALLLSGFMLVNSVSAYSVDNGFISNIKELKELSDIMNIIKENHVGAEKEATNTTLMQGALKGMMESLDDPHSNYFTKEELESFKEDIEGKYAGVGMVIQKKSDEPLIVVSPIEDTPAYLAGIRAKDKIIAIDGESTYKLTSEQSVKKLKGEPGTSVKLTVYREEAKETKEVELKRSLIQLKYVKSKMLSNDVGYLRLTQFGEDVYKDL